jgi:hypothetical protein
MYSLAVSFWDKTFKIGCHPNRLETLFPFVFRPFLNIMNIMADDARELQHITQLLDRGDVRAARRALKPIYQRRRHEAPVLYLVARVNEASDRDDLAERIYRDLLKSGDAPPSLMTKARQGLERLAVRDRLRRNERIASAKLTKPDRLGLLILEATPAERRRDLAQHIARILDIDLYTARIQLQTHGWRLYRIGDFATLDVYGRDLRGAGVQTFWVDRADIDTIEVFCVDYLEQVEPNFVAVCRDSAGQVGRLEFARSDVARQVRGGVPFFVDAVSYDISKQDKDKVKRKLEIRDFVQIIDLHLPDRNCILRFCDRSYRFDQGAIFTVEQLEQEQKGLKTSSATTRINWNGMLTAIDRLCPTATLWREFTPFAETAIDYYSLMSGIISHVEIARSQPSNWDSAFQLYSTLVWLREAEIL